MCFVAVHLYTSSKHAAISSGLPLWALAGTLEFFFVSFFAVFVSQMNAKYRITFFSTMTGKQFCALRFRQATTDEARADILEEHPAYWRSIRHEVEQWVRENYFTWTEENPEWLERLKRRIPAEFIPDDDEEEAGLIRTSTVRRNTNGEKQYVKEAAEAVGA